LHAKANLFERPKRLWRRRRKCQVVRRVLRDLVLETLPLKNRERQHVHAGLHRANGRNIGFAVHEHAVGDDGHLRPGLDLPHVRGRGSVIVGTGHEKEPASAPFNPPML
jgi:hypothetical protein